jgi:hypothetical protein
MKKLGWILGFQTVVFGQLLFGTATELSVWTNMSQYPMPWVTAERQVASFVWSDSYIGYYASDVTHKNWFYNKIGWIYSDVAQTPWEQKTQWKELDVNLSSAVGAWSYVYGKGWWFFWGSKPIELSYVNMLHPGSFDNTPGYFNDTPPYYTLDFTGYTTKSLKDEIVYIWNFDHGWLATTENLYPKAWSYSISDWVDL